MRLFAHFLNFEASLRHWFGSFWTKKGNVWGGKKKEEPKWEWKINGFLSVLGLCFEGAYFLYTFCNIVLWQNMYLLDMKECFVVCFSLAKRADLKQLKKIREGQQ